jgi:hypothetical protein
MFLFILKVGHLYHIGGIIERGMTFSVEKKSQKDLSLTPCCPSRTCSQVTKDFPYMYFNLETKLKIPRE